MNGSLPTLTRASFRGSAGGALKRLPGWRANYAVPKEVNSYTRAFVQRLAEEHLKERLTDLHARIKETFGYRRKQIETSEGGGFATCKTPDFDLEIAVTIDPEDPSRYLETISVTALMDERLLASEAFAELFDGQFTEVFFEYSQPFDIETLIDTLEEREIPGMKLAYPPDASRCTLELDSEGLCIEFVAHEMRFLLEGKPRIETIGEILLKGRRLLKDPGLILLPSQSAEF